VKAGKVVGKQYIKVVGVALVIGDEIGQTFLGQLFLKGQ
jgi:hypothetical protein